MSTRNHHRRLQFRTTMSSALMSDDDPSPDADNGRRDSAYSLHSMQDPPVRSLSTLADDELYPLINEPAWGAVDAGSDFHYRFAAAAYSSARAPESISEYSSPSDGDNGAMALTLNSCISIATAAAPRTPSLGSYPTAPSKSSIQTWEAESAIGVGPIDNDGNLVDLASLAVQPPSGLPCLFSFLDCPQTFLNPVAWHDHSKSHFHGAAPPTCMQCPQSDCAWSVKTVDGEATWAACWTHLVCEHDLPAESGCVWKRPSTALIQYLYGIRVITSAQYQELRKQGQLGVESRAYTVVEGDEKHRRGNRRPHVAARR